MKLVEFVINMFYYLFHFIVLIIMVATIFTLAGTDYSSGDDKKTFSSSSSLEEEYRKGLEKLEEFSARQKLEEQVDRLFRDGP